MATRTAALLEVLLVAMMLPSQVVALLLQWLSNNTAAQISSDDGSETTTASTSSAQKERAALPMDSTLAVKRLMACAEHDFYEILYADMQTSAADIRKLFRRQSLLVHPDKCSHTKAQAAFQRLSLAYEVLGNEVWGSSLYSCRHDLKTVFPAFSNLFFNASTRLCIISLFATQRFLLCIALCSSLLSFLYFLSLLHDRSFKPIPTVCVLLLG